MNIILIAPPAAGKGTASELLCNKHNFKHISTGDLIREIINSNNELSIKLKEVIEQGKLVDDELILNLIKYKIKNDDNYIFDGFPRNINQAKLFDNLLNDLNRKVNYVIYLKIDKELAQKRILGRLTCSKCGKIYNDQLEGSIPINTGKCDDCNSDLNRRTDDNVETFNKRFDTYMNETRPVLDYYKEKLYEVDSTDKYKSLEQIESIIGI